MRLTWRPDSSLWDEEARQVLTGRGYTLKPCSGGGRWRAAAVQIGARTALSRHPCHSHCFRGWLGCQFFSVHLDYDDIGGKL